MCGETPNLKKETLKLTEWELANFHLPPVTTVTWYEGIAPVGFLRDRLAAQLASGTATRPAKTSIKSFLVIKQTPAVVSRRPSQDQMRATHTSGSSVRVTTR